MQCHVKYQEAVAINLFVHLTINGGCPNTLPITWINAFLKQVNDSQIITFVLENIYPNISVQNAVGCFDLYTVYLKIILCTGNTEPDQYVGVGDYT